MHPERFSPAYHRRGRLSYWRSQSSSLAIVYETHTDTHMQKHKISLKHAQNKTAVSYYWDGQMCHLHSRLDVHLSGLRPCLCMWEHKFMSIVLISTIESIRPSDGVQGHSYDHIKQLILWVRNGCYAELA